MKLISILRAMDDDELVEVWDENAPIFEACLFAGSVKECKSQGHFRNGVVNHLTAVGDTMVVYADIEYQKRKAVAIND